MRVGKPVIQPYVPRPLPITAPDASSAPQPEIDLVPRHVAEACDAVYDEAKARAWTTKEGVTDWTPFGGAIMRAMAYRHKGQLYVIFRGTHGLRDVLTDLHCLYWRSPPRHNGFSLAWGRLKPAVEEWVRVHSNGPPVIFAGHSLGGAIAVLAASDLAAIAPNAQIITFGCPRVGSPEFAWAFEKQKIPIRRFVHAKDGITVVPPFGLYFPIGAPIDLRPHSEVNRNPLPIYLRPSEPNQSAFQQVFAIVLQLIHPALGHAFANSEETRKVIDPSTTSLGRLALGSTRTGIKLMFWLLLVPLLLGLITILFHPVSTSTRVQQTLGAHAWLRWMAAGALLLTIQQVVFAVAWGCPVWLRLMFGLAAASWVGTHLTFPEISVGLVFLIAIFFLAGYRLLGGSTDHPMAFYVRLLGGKPVRE